MVEGYWDSSQLMEPGEGDRWKMHVCEGGPQAKTPFGCYETLANGHGTDEVREREEDLEATLNDYGL